MLCINWLFDCMAWDINIREQLSPPLYSQDTVFIQMEIIAFHLFNNLYLISDVK